MKQLILLSIIPVLALLAVSPRQPRPVPAIPDSSVTVHYSGQAKVTFPVLVVDNGVLFEVKVNDAAQPLFFTIDSGAGATYLNTETARRLGMIASGEGTVHGAGSGAVPVKHLENVHFELPGVSTLHPQINTADLSDVPKQWGHQIDGFFGFDFIRKFVVTIDYDAGMVTLADPEEFTYEGVGDILPIKFEPKLPYVPGLIKYPGIPPTRSLFLIDSGSGDGVNHPLVKKSKGKLTSTESGVGLGQSTQGVLGHIEYLKLGKFEIRGAPSTAWDNFGHPDPSRGHIGNAALRRFKVILDYSRSRMIIEPGALYGRPFQN